MVAGEEWHPTSGALEAGEEETGGIFKALCKSSYGNFQDPRAPQVQVYSVALVIEGAQIKHLPQFLALAGGGSAFNGYRLVDNLYRATYGTGVANDKYAVRG